MARWYAPPVHLHPPTPLQVKGAVVRRNDNVWGGTMRTSLSSASVCRTHPQRHHAPGGARVGHAPCPICRCRAEWECGSCRFLALFDGHPDPFWLPPNHDRFPRNERMYQTLSAVCQTRGAAIPLGAPSPHPLIGVLLLGAAANMREQRVGGSSRGASESGGADRSNVFGHVLVLLPVSRGGAHHRYVPVRPLLSGWLILYRGGGGQRPKKSLCT